MKLDSASGIMLIFAAMLAMITVNSPLAGLYLAFQNTPVEIRLGALHIDKPLLLWINDGLMAVFFMLIGLEIKREIFEGELSRFDQVVLPGLGAAGGMLMPALIYVSFNWGDEVAINGWAIPAATDIAFALGILALLRDRVPLSLRVFLMALAILDDLGAIVIIAVFYTAELSLNSLLVALLATVVLFTLNRMKVTRIDVYIAVGVILWFAVLKSGVHATLAGVVLGFAIPLQDARDPDRSPLRDVEHNLHQWVAFGIIPVFAFANAGVSLQGLSLDMIAEPIPLGIAAGLFFGKQAGIMLFCSMAILLGFARLPTGANWLGFYGVSILAGIGFTMSLFITSLAFTGDQAGNAVEASRLGIIVGSTFSAVIGYLLLRFTNPGDMTKSPSG